MTPLEVTRQSRMNDLFADRLCTARVYKYSKLCGCNTLEEVYMYDKEFHMMKISGFGAKSHANIEYLYELALDNEGISLADKSAPITENTFLQVLFREGVIDARLYSICRGAKIETIHDLKEIRHKEYGFRLFKGVGIKKNAELIQLIDWADRKLPIEKVILAKKEKEYEVV